MVLYFLKTDYEENVYIKTKHLLLKRYCHDNFFYFTLLFLLFTTLNKGIYDPLLI